MANSIIPKSLASEVNAMTKCGYMKWADVSVASASWRTNVGNESSGYTPNGQVIDGAYNMLLDIAGTYYVHLHACFENSNANGARGIRLYKTEVAQGVEYFVAPVSLRTISDVGVIVDSDGRDSIRMGLFQSSGETITVKELSATAILLHRN